jgi:hypothetical protein
MLLKICEAFQSALNKLAQHPFSLGIAVGFLVAWTTASLLSGGKFDSGLGIENLIINGLSILLLFAANTARENNHDVTHDRLDEINQNLLNIKENNAQ